MSSLLFRLLSLLLRLPFYARTQLFERVTLNGRVWPLDLDLNLHVNNARYLALMDLGRVQVLGQAGVLKLMFRRRWMAVAQAVEIRYIRELKPFQAFQLESQLLGWDDKYWYVEQQFKVQGQLYATAWVRGLFLQGRTKIAPNQLASLLNLPEQSPPLPEAVERWRQLRERA